MPNVGFKMGEQSALDTLLRAGVKAGAIAGTFYLTSDTNRLYIGKDDGSIKPVNAGIITVANTNSLPDVTSLSVEEKKKIAGNYYYATEQNILCVFNGKNWVQINSVITNDSFTQAASAVTGGARVSSVITDTNGKEVTASFTVVGDKGIGVTGSGTQITVSGDPITVTTATASNTATSTIKSASGTTDTSIGIKGGKNVTVSSSGNVITVDAEDKYVSKLYGASRAEGFAVYGEYNDGSMIADATLNPIVKLDGTIKNDTKEFKFVNGTATLPVYSAKEVDSIKTTLENSFEAKLKGFNAMEYKGTVGTEGTLKALPTTADNIKNGYSYLVAGSLTVGSETYLAGTLVVASGNEDSSTGYLTTLTWSYVTGSTADTLYTGNVVSNGAIELVPSTGGNAVASINVVAGKDMTVSAGGTVGGNTQTYTVDHATYTNETFGTTGATAATAMAAKASAYEIPVISGITVQNGHITGVTATKYTVKDTNVTIGSTVATVSSIANSNVATVKHITILEDGAGSEIKSPKDAEFSISSSSLEVTASSASNVAINLVWGSF